MRIVLLFLFLIPLTVDGQSKRKQINLYYHNVINPYFQVLGLRYDHLTTRRDSQRLDLPNGAYLDIFIRNKKLHNLRRVDTSGNVVNIGSFKDGNGKVHLRFGDQNYEAIFQNGVLQDSALHYWMNPITGYLYGGKAVRRFKDGLLHGVSKQYAQGFPDFINTYSTYKDGVLVEIENYGIRHTFWYMLWHPQQYFPYPLYSKSICSRTTYDDRGRITNSECFVKKCRRCL